MRYLILFAIVMGFLFAGCSGIGQKQPKDCGYEYTNCLEPAEESCTPAFGRLDNGQFVMYEKIDGLQENNCKIDMNIEKPAYLNNMTAGCNIPKDVLASMAFQNSSDLTSLCKYCTGTMIDAFKQSKVC